MAMETVILKPQLLKTLAGDIGLWSSNTWLSKAIRFFEHLQTGSANKSHSFACLGDDQVIEALMRVKINDIEKYDGKDVEIWRLPLSESDRLNFKRGMLKVAGDGYGLGKIALAAMDSLASVVGRFFGRKKPVFWFSKKFNLTSFKDCSQLIVWGLQKFTVYRLHDENHSEISWSIVTPDYLQDLFHLPHNKAELIYKQKAA